MATKIEWAQESWNPITGCSPISEGCRSCYAKRMAHRLKGRFGYPKDDPFQVTFHPDRLEQPLKWKKPRMIFVCSMGDLFHEGVEDNWRDQIFAVMAMLKEHTFMALTKRPKGMLSYMSDIKTPFRVAKAIDTIEVEREMALMPLKMREIPGYERYLIRNDGIVFTTHGSAICVYCGKDTTGYAKRRYCSQKCKEKAQYLERIGRELPYPDQATPMRPDIGEDGHMRVMLYKNTAGYRELVHRLVLTVFDRPPKEGEQCCHRNGNPTINGLPNLRWGTQEDNWKDRVRHGNGASIEPPIDWPPKNIWAGTTAENQQRADERIPVLLQVPAAKRFVSLEPLLSPIHTLPLYLSNKYEINSNCPEFLDWVIVGAETGPGARYMNPDWARSIRDQCRDSGVPFFMKKMSNKEPIPHDLRIREGP